MTPSAHPGASAAPSRRHSRREPIVDLASGEAVGFEVLARPALGRLARPNGFARSSAWWFDAEIALGEATDLQWQDGAPLVHLNVVASDLRRPTLLSSIAHLPGSQRERLVLEVTEHGPIGWRAAVEGPLATLRQLGVRFAIDDFGVGGANLTLVALIGPEILKVTRTAIADDDWLARWVVDLARSLGAVTVLEEIATHEDLAWARRMGFDRGQGSLWPRL